MNSGDEQTRQELRRVNREDDLFYEIPLWGCPEQSFKANLPFNGMWHAASSAERQAYAAFEKEIPKALRSTTVGFFKTLKVCLL